MPLSKDDILGRDDRRTEEVAVPEWSGSVLVRGMTGRERDEFEASLDQQRGGQYVRDYANVRARVLVKCMVNEQGERVFTDQDANALGEQSAAALDRIYDVAARLSGLRGEDVAAKTADFTPATGSDTSTGSPNGLAVPSPVS